MKMNGLHGNTLFSITTYTLQKNNDIFHLIFSVLSAHNLDALENNFMSTSVGVI